MHRDGIVGPPASGAKSREILVSPPASTVSTRSFASQTG
jgi:hypothetical protein